MDPSVANVLSQSAVHGPFLMNLLWLFLPICLQRKPPIKETHFPPTATRSDPYSICPAPDILYLGLPQHKHAPNATNPQFFLIWLIIDWWLLNIFRIFFKPYLVHISLFATFSQQTLTLFKNQTQSYIHSLKSHFHAILTSLSPFFARLLEMLRFLSRLRTK